MIEMSAKIRKASITPLGAFKGMTNSTPFDTGNPEMAKPGAIVFRGFAGGLNIKSGLYEGVFRFEDSSPEQVSVSTNFAEILKADVKPEANTAPKKPAKAVEVKDA